MPKLTNTEKVLWEHSTEAAAPVGNAVLQVVIFFVSAIIFVGLMVSAFRSGSDFHWLSLIPPSSVALVSVVHFLRWTDTVLKASSTRYTVYEDRIVISDNTFIKRAVCILFSDIWRIRKVESDAGPYDTIYINTVSNVPYRGTDFSKGERREAITLEYVPKGSGLLELLERQRLSSFSPIAGSILLDDQVRDPFVPRLLTLFCGLMYAGLALCMVLFLVDRFLLIHQWETSVVENVKKKYDHEGTSYGARLYMHNGRVLDTYSLYAKGAELSYKLTPIFEVPVDLMARGQRTPMVLSFHLNGYRTGLDLIVLGMLVFCSLYIVRNRGFITYEESLFFLGGPVLFLLLAVWLL